VSESYEGTAAGRPWSVTALEASRVRIVFGELDMVMSAEDAEPFGEAIGNVAGNILDGPPVTLTLFSPGKSEYDNGKVIAP
jgi:hypothetical protein